MPLDFDYERRTREHYKDKTVAEVYHGAFSKKVTWRTFRFHFVAARERRRVEAFLDAVPSERVLDMPCGTGKVAATLAKRERIVTAADISPEMLDVARESYAQARAKNVTFVIADAEHLSATFKPNEFDVVVCLRLLHRVPAEIRARILAQLAAVAPRAIISFGVSSPYHRVRRWLRNLVFGGGAHDSLCQAPLREIRRELSASFRVGQSQWVARGLSEEILFLCESKDAPSR